MNQIPTIGRIVHYHFINGRGHRVARPAIVVEVWGSSDPNAALNLQVFLDGTNDAAPPFTGPAPATLWATSAPSEANRGASEAWWTWPPRA